MAKILSSTTGNGPTLNKPTNETVTNGGTVAVSGSYADSFAQGNPGQLYLSISDSSGLLSATDASGNAVAGSGGHSIGISTDYTDVNAILASLRYAASASGTSDTIRFDVWNQAGTETTGSVPVTVSGTSSAAETWTGVVSSDWNNAANWSGGAVPTSGDTVLIASGTPNNATLSNATLTGETITLQQSTSMLPVVDFNNVTLDSVLRASGNGRAQVDIGGTLTVGAQGTVQAGAGTGLSLLGTADTIVNNGLLAAIAGGGLDILNSQSNNATAATLINNGSIVADNGQVSLLSTAYLPSAPPEWNVQNAGSVTIANGGGLMLDGTLNGGQVTFSGAGNLALAQKQALAGGATISGFGVGDSLALYGLARDTVSDFNNGTLQVGSGGSTEDIGLNGSYTLGNFENGMVGGSANSPSVIAYAPDRGSSSGVVNPDIVAPASDSVAQGSTLALGDVSILEGGSASGSTNVTLGIGAGSGTLYMNGASGNGTSHLSLGLTSLTQANADLSSLTYVPAAGSSADTVSLNVSTGVADTVRSIPVAIGGSGTGGPALHEPGGESVAAGGTVAVSGSYSDSFAAGNPGAMYLHIADCSGTLSATDASGNPVAGSGSNSITVSTDYADVNAVLHSLTYGAGLNGGSDTISFDIWNQAGTETTGSVPVTIGGSSSGPVLTEPSSESVAAKGTVAVGGSYTDSFAQANPGQLWLGISDSSGTLSSTDASGHVVAGSGTNSIGLSTDYVDLNAILANLHYAAGDSAGSDTIRFDVWNQSGTETTAATAVTLGPGSMASALTQASQAMMANFAAPTASGSSTLVPGNTPSFGSSSAALNDIGRQPAGIPLTLHG